MNSHIVFMQERFVDIYDQRSIHIPRQIVEEIESASKDGRSFLINRNVIPTFKKILGKCWIEPRLMKKERGRRRIYLTNENVG